MQYFNSTFMTHEMPKGILRNSFKTNKRLVWLADIQSVHNSKRHDTYGIHPTGKHPEESRNAGSAALSVIIPATGCSQTDCCARQ
jgi:hypothetical protein